MISAARPKRRSRAKVDNRKRAIYVNKACTQCQSRKTKCDGSLPCENCRRRSLDCVYNKAVREDQSESDSSKVVPGSTSSEQSNPIGLTELTDLVSNLQKKVAQLEQNKHDLSPNGQHPPSSSQDPGVSETQSIANIISSDSPVFAGPTSSNFSLGVARLILDHDDGGKESSRNFNPELAGSASCWEDDDVTGAEEQLREYEPTYSMPWYGLEMGDALRLLQGFHECVAIMHPVVDMEAMANQVTTIWQFSSAPSPPQPKHFSATIDNAHLYMVLAIALLAEGGGSSAIAAAIYNNLETEIAKQILAKNFTSRGQVLLLLAAFYQVLQDDHRLASRYVAITCRLLMEAGLHQNSVRLRRYPSNTHRTQILTILSTCVILDRQLNFNAGLPFTMKDTDIDLPETETLPAYMKAMAAYARIGPPAWAAMSDDQGKIRSRIRDEDFNYLDYQVRCWQDSLPEELRPSHIVGHDTSSGSEQHSLQDRGTVFLRYILYLRANQFKIVILRPLLFSTITVRANIKRVKVLADIANDTISIISEMNSNCDLYRDKQSIVNVFLSSAMSTLTLIYIHGLKNTSGSPEEVSSFNSSVREGIEKALALVCSYATCRSAQRLWKRHSGRNGLLSRLGFTQAANVDSDPASSLRSSSSPAVLQLQPQVQSTGPSSSVDSASISFPEYVPYGGFGTVNHGNFHSGMMLDGFPALSMFDANSLSGSGDINFLFDDVWQ